MVKNEMPEKNGQKSGELRLRDSSEIYLTRRYDGVDFTFVKPGKYESGNGKDRHTVESQPGIRVRSTRGFAKGESVLSLKSILEFNTVLDKIVKGKPDADKELHDWLNEINQYEREHAAEKLVEIPEYVPEVEEHVGSIEVQN